MKHNALISFGFIEIRQIPHRSELNCSSYIAHELQKSVRLRTYRIRL